MPSQAPIAQEGVTIKQEKSLRSNTKALRSYASPKGLYQRPKMKNFSETQLPHDLLQKVQPA